MTGKNLIAHHFPAFSDSQLRALEQYALLLLESNQRVNLISRKNEGRIWEEHILHALGILKVTNFAPGTKVLDIGTGGGLPGIPLAIACPETEFLLVDSIGKKVREVEHMAREMALNNVRTKHARVEDLSGTFDFAVSRAVTALPKLAEWLEGKLTSSPEPLSAGLLYIKGGDFQDELNELSRPHEVWNLRDWFEDPFFETKKVVWVAV